MKVNDAVISSTRMAGILLKMGASNVVSLNDCIARNSVSLIVFGVAMVYYLCQLWIRNMCVSLSFVNGQCNLEFTKSK